MFHSIINPFIYYNQNKRIHEAVNELLVCLLNCYNSADPRRTSSTFATFVTDEHRKSQKASGTQAIRIVNMIAYMPVSNNDNERKSTKA